MRYIDLNKPSELKTKAFYSKVEKLAKSGIKSKDINIICNFITDDLVYEYISDEFRKLKNRIYFLIDNKIY